MRPRRPVYREDSRTRHAGTAPLIHDSHLASADRLYRGAGCCGLLFAPPCANRLHIRSASGSAAGHRWPAAGRRRNPHERDDAGRSRDGRRTGRGVGIQDTDPGAGVRARRCRLRGVADPLERHDRPEAGARRALPGRGRRHRLRPVRARAQSPALRQGRRPQHRRAGGGRRRHDAGHVADAWRLGGSRAKDRPGAGGLPAGRRGPRDPGARAGHGSGIRVGHRGDRAHARRGVRLPDAPLGLDVGQRGRHGRRDRRGAARARERRREPGPVLGIAGRRRQLRRRHPDRLRAASGRAGNRGRPRGVACQRRAGRARVLPDLRRAGAARADAGRPHAPGASRAVAAERRARQAHRRAARLLHWRPCEGRDAPGSAEGAGPPNRRRPRAPPLHAAPVAARRHPAEGPPLLLEERVPAADRTRPCARSSSGTRRPSPRRTRRSSCSSSRAPSTAWTAITRRSGTATRATCST